jgi:hypothetical protein
MTSPEKSPKHTQEQTWLNYLQQQGDVAAQNRFERTWLDDPLGMDALEGLDRMDPQTLQEDTRLIQHQLNALIQKKKKAKRKKNTTLMPIWIIGAVLLILLLIMLAWMVLRGF